MKMITIFQKKKKKSHKLSTNSNQNFMEKEKKKHKTQLRKSKNSIDKQERKLNPD